MLTKADEVKTITRRPPRQSDTLNHDDILDAPNPKAVRDFEMLAEASANLQKQNQPLIHRVWVFLTTPGAVITGVQLGVIYVAQFLWAHRRGYCTRGARNIRLMSHCNDCTFHIDGFCDPPGPVNCRCGKHRASRTMYKCHLAGFKCPIGKFGYERIRFRYKCLRLPAALLIALCILGAMYGSAWLIVQGIRLSIYVLTMV